MGIVQDDSTREGGMSEGQGSLGNVVEGVQVAELEGHRSRSAVYLVHKGLGQRRADAGRRSPQGDYFNKAGCYHTRSMNVL
jgi:hypothetical protein